MLHLVLASASPARLSLLRAAGVAPEVMVSGVDESGVTGPAMYVAGELARMKARAVADRLTVSDAAGSPGAALAARAAAQQPAQTALPDSSTALSDFLDSSAAQQSALPTLPGALGSRAGDVLVLGCDSVLEFDGEVFGKPADAADAKDRWLRMRGKSGVLHTGHHLIRGTREAGAVASTVVRFADVSDMEIDAYVATREPLRVAGAFTLDGLGGWFVDGIDGDPGTVIGLSLPLLRRLLATFELSVADLWSATA